MIFRKKEYLTNVFYLYGGSNPMRMRSVKRAPYVHLELNDNLLIATYRKELCVKLEHRQTNCHRQEAVYLTSNMSRSDPG